MSVMPRLNITRRTNQYNAWKVLERTQEILEGKESDPKNIDVILQNLFRLLEIWKYTHFIFDDGVEEVCKKLEEAYTECFSEKPSKDAAQHIEDMLSAFAETREPEEDFLKFLKSAHKKVERMI